MNLTLNRTHFIESGIFGELLTEDFMFLCLTLEHAYQCNDDFAPKIPTGEYLCKRGMHRLEGHDKDFETFEITDVPGHTSILFHQGNVNADSSGCVLLGSGWGSTSGGGKMICDSKKAFEAFIKLQEGCDSFILKVK